jgi:hypothetical protein
MRCMAMAFSPVDRFFLSFRRRQHMVELAYVRDGSRALVLPILRHVRFSPGSRREGALSDQQLQAKNGK